MNHSQAERIGPGAIQIAGIKMGVGCAQKVLQNPLIAAKIRDTYLADAKKANDALNVDDTVFLDSFNLGMSLKLKNPDRRIEINGIGINPDKPFGLE